MNPLEEMSDFFTARVDGYDEHMLRDVEGCQEGYPFLATVIPSSTRRLLDLGCGTGLELDFIWARYPELSVTGVDMTPAMLDVLRKKHPTKDLTLICGDYFKVDLGTAYDCAVSFETLHHFTHEQKHGLYRRIHDALTDGGCYIEADYMVHDEALEELYAVNLARLRAEQGIPDGVFVHYDTPFTVDHQIALLKSAGFVDVEVCFDQANLVILKATKEPIA